jgi:2-phospho-L-lactate guanylyltransferase
MRGPRHRPARLSSPADIPLIRANELAEVLAQAPQEGSVLVPAADGRGTNAAFRRPANLFPLRFGNDSFKPHLAAARATGNPALCCNFPKSWRLTSINPEDLQQLLDRPGETRTQSLLRQWSKAGRFLLTQKDGR